MGRVAGAEREGRVAGAGGVGRAEVGRAEGWRMEGVEGWVAGMKGRRFGWERGGGRGGSRLVVGRGGGGRE